MEKKFEDRHGHNNREENDTEESQRFLEMFGRHGGNVLTIQWMAILSMHRERRSMFEQLQNRAMTFIREHYKWVALMASLLISCSFAVKERASEAGRQFGESYDH